MTQKNIARDQRAFNLKYNLNISYPTYWKYSTLENKTDKEISKINMQRGGNRYGVNTIMSQWREWKKDTGSKLSYGWFIQHMNES